MLLAKSIVKSALRMFTGPAIQWKYVRDMHVSIDVCVCVCVCARARAFVHAIAWQAHGKQTCTALFWKCVQH